MSLHTKEITTLGRGGSDLTAIALAHVLNADFCEIYKDVDGVFTADPRVVPSAKKISCLPLSALLELTWYGASVLHARGAFLAKKFEIPLVLRSSFNFDIPGTQVAKKGVLSMEMEGIVVNAVTHKTSQTLIKISSNVNGLYQKAIKWLWSKGESPIINQNQTNSSNNNLEICFVMSSELIEQFSIFLASCTGSSKITLTTKPDLATLSIVGEGFWQDPEFVADILSLVTHPFEIFESKNNVLTICMPDKFLVETINIIHKEVIEKFGQR
jgi:aspartate kinase